ncbi:hypothetical protein [Oceanobacillus kimchii]|uniref:hypothetical protein n=1 Tax=Oceanobacillus kimchii TaxID=746691 RepID=UPI000984A083|nr:hypothetical protein [Oceanobacillus kimchii]
MVETYVSFYMEHSAFRSTPIQHGLSTADVGSSVEVSIVQGKMTNGYPAKGANFDWIMELNGEKMDV